MITRILFMSAAAFLAYQYIRRSNKKVEELNAPPDAPKNIEMLPPRPKPAAAEELRSARTTPRISAAAEDFVNR